MIECIIMIALRTLKNDLVHFNYFFAAVINKIQIKSSGLLLPPDFGHFS